MAKKRTLENQIVSDLKNKIAFGESRHEAKENLSWGESDYKIHSYDTYSTYKKECLQFQKWLVEIKQENKYIKLSESEKYVKEYLDYCKENNCSLYTLKMRRSALGMLYNHTIDYKLDVRHYIDVKRSRKEVENDKHYSEKGKYRDLFVIMKSTGGRRCDIEKMKLDDFKYINNHLYVEIDKSKGGRNRLAVVLNSKEVLEIIENRKQEGRTLLFDKVPAKIDVHSYRREYCKELYRTVENDKDLREDLLRVYPARKEKVQRDFYKDRQNNIFNRDSLYLCTQCLGHARLNVCVNHYLS